MKYLKKIFESNRLELNNHELVKLQELIEDTLSYFSVEVRPELSLDSYYDNSGNYIEYTASVLFLITPKLAEYKSMQGNPYSTNSIDIDMAFKRQQDYVDSIAKFTREIKSLCYRLSKSGYVINAYGFDGVNVNIWFMVEDEKIIRKIIF